MSWESTEWRLRHCPAHVLAEKVYILNEMKFHVADGNSARVFFHLVTDYLSEVGGHRMYSKCQYRFLKLFLECENNPEAQHFRPHSGQLDNRHENILKSVSCCSSRFIHEIAVLHVGEDDDHLRLLWLENTCVYAHLRTIYKTLKRALLFCRELNSTYADFNEGKSYWNGTAKTHEQVLDEYMSDLDDTFRGSNII